MASKVYFCLVGLGLLGGVVRGEAPSECTPGNNNLGECGCAEQIFINKDCTQGYYCSNSTSGCGITCGEGKILLVDPRNESFWRCVDYSIDLARKCPGKMNTDCEKCEEESCPFGECDCPQQYFVSADCKTARTCNDRFINNNITCTDNTIVDINLSLNTSLSLKCIEDDGRCLNRAFNFGCSAATTTTTTSTTTTTMSTTTKSSTVLCSYANNTLGTCECGKQLFINKDCTEGFYCMESGFPEGVKADGCIKSCRPDEILIVDVGKYDWECVPKSFSPGLNRICPGEFHVECPGNGDIGECECDGQLWINDDCRKGFYCSSKMPGGGQDISCKEEERINVNMINQTWSCVPDDGLCPGGLHTQCETTTTTTEPNAAPAIFSSLFTIQILGIILYFTV
ncbi:uncharacterized protein LOC111699505 [Eurytemora carolleeae]|uniref:uncharacterized protein LOC111699505 n=1 Tax=Eurytemora carolleeae TaxID=1294199 RepID=UPI000C76F414|nr:uncharacterized protein LOC111699505 [Eurytemora carolleeae]|eukprot:XP_023325961.1 uncharacterized protein LOC111699505 [Eurytemora affinis]